jgi:hypothetical protein
MRRAGGILEFSMARIRLPDASLRRFPRAYGYHCIYFDKW